MTFLADPDLWPVDRSGKYTFIVKALQEIGRSLNHKNLRLPSILYRYEESLPDFDSATEDEKQLATEILLQNEAYEYVEVSERKLYSETDNESVVIVNYLIEREQWRKVQEILAMPSADFEANVMSSVAIGSALFEGIATEGLVAAVRSNKRPEFTPLAAYTLNISNPEIIKARLALGQIDVENPFSTQAAGGSFIFVENASLNRWKNGPGSSIIKIEIARYRLMTLAKEYINGLPHNMKKDDLLGMEFTGFRLLEKEKEDLWNRLPDRPFKIPGLRIGTEKKGRGKNR